jgi:hypothetical protein
MIRVADRILNASSTPNVKRPLSAAGLEPGGYAVWRGTGAHTPNTRNPTDPTKPAGGLFRPMPRKVSRGQCAHTISEPDAA